MKIQELLMVWKTVFTRKYSLLAIIVAAIFYLFNVIIKNVDTIVALADIADTKTALIFVWSLAFGFYATVTIASYISLIAISLLIGIVVALLVFKIKVARASRTRGGISSGLGIFLGVIAPGCAACGVGLAALFGISAAGLSLLPLKGLELSLLAIVLLLISIWQLSKGLLVCEACRSGLRKLRQQ